MADETPDRLVLAIVQVDDVRDLLEHLVERNLRVTRIHAAGGFLRRDNAVVLVATTEARVSIVTAAIRATCRTRTATWLPAIDDGTVGLYTEPIEVEVGGAVVFVLPIERVEYLGLPNDPVRLAAAAHRPGGEA